MTDHILGEWRQAPAASLIAGAAGAILALLIVRLANRASREPGRASSVIEYERDLALFRKCVWVVIVCSFGALITKAIWHRPGDVPVHYLLALVLVSVFVVTFARSLGAFARSHLRKISVGGFEVELSADVELARQFLINSGIPPSVMIAGETDQIPSDNPFPMKRLTGPQLYQYEKLSHRIYLVFSEIEDPNSLGTKPRENLRKLIMLVGGAALAEKHYTKALDILLWLKRFPVSEVGHDELRVLGVAYLWAADEQADEAEARRHVGHAVLVLKDAIEKNPYGVLATFQLGLGLLRLGRHPDGIEMMQECLRLDQNYTPWAKWSIACGLKKLSQEDQALKILGEIAPGRWWQEMARDDWFRDPQQPKFVYEFQQLCQTKIDEYELNDVFKAVLGKKTR